MIGDFGNILLSLGFVIGVMACVFYVVSLQSKRMVWYRVAHLSYILKTVCLCGVAGILIYLLFTHQYQYFYVYNHTSNDLAPHFIWSAFYGGQEGSFLFWLLLLAFIGLFFLKRKPQKLSTMFLFFYVFMELTIYTMILGWQWGDIGIGLSPFRTLAEALPNAPFLQENPHYIPLDGKGLNDLLKSPWMMIHPPMLFLSYAVAVIPFCYVLAGLYQKKYKEALNKSISWLILTNAALLLAIFLGGYWAYVTLSFGGFWAWDPVENASLVPWLLGIAGLHLILVQRNNHRYRVYAIALTLLCFISIAYESYITRSGALSDASVHSFVDLGLATQLFLFFFITVLIPSVLIAYRWRDLKPQKTSKKPFLWQSMMVWGAVLLFFLSMMIIVATSAPLYGSLFGERIAPPSQSFYNEWSIILALPILILTVLSLFMLYYWHHVKSIYAGLLIPLVLTTMSAMGIIFMLYIQSWQHILLVLCSVFSFWGNGYILYILSKKNLKKIGSAVSHLGFVMLVLGSLLSGGYSTSLLDERSTAYNRAVRLSKGTELNNPSMQEEVNFFELNYGEPKLIGDRFYITYEGYTMENYDPGRQKYKLRLDDIRNEGQSFYLYPEVYPMRASSTETTINWGVEPAVKLGFMEDIYTYIAGSQYVEKINQKMMEEFENTENNTKPLKMVFERGEKKEVGPYTIWFEDFEPLTEDELSEDMYLGVKMRMSASHRITNQEASFYLLYIIRTTDDVMDAYSSIVNVEPWEFRVQVAKLLPENDAVELLFFDMDMAEQPDWVLAVIERKPFISLVWLGVGVMLVGFGIAYYQRITLNKTNKT